MKNYILADLKRIIKKKSFVFAILAFAILYILLIFIVVNETFTGEQYKIDTTLFINFFPLFVGIPIFLSVYNDDFKSKSMQVAIGYGISRPKIILTKIIDTIILTCVTGILYLAVFLLLPFAFNFPISSADIAAITITFISSLILIIGYTAISNILLYATENAVFGIITFILLASSTVSMVLSLILSQNFIVNLFGVITQYLFTTGISTQVQNILQMGHPTISLLFILLGYIALPIVISIILFNKKELEF